MVEQLAELMNVGEEWILWLLIVTSVACVAFFIERSIVLFRNKGNLNSYRDKLSKFLAEGNADGAKKYFAGINTSPAKILSVALGHLDRSPEALQEAIDQESIVQRMKLERFLDFLGSVGSNAPFIGLLGTVLGIIQAFQALSNAQTAEPQVVMAGISSALVATALGLAVAIPALVFFNYFKGIVRDIMRTADILTKPLMSHSLDQALGRPTAEKSEEKKG